MFEKFKTKEGYSEDIQMIHNEFMTASDILLQEAREIIKNTNLVNEDKINRLKKLGFTASKEVADTKDAIKKREMSKDTAELIEYYKVNYPLNKFITEDQVRTICEKYGLVYGEIIRYTGFIPEKNLKDVENWKGLKENDKLFASIRSESGDIVEFVKSSDIKKEYIKTKLMEDKELYVYGSGTSECKVIKDNGYGEFGRIKIEEGSSSLIIAAPLKDMKIDNTEEIKNHQIVKKHIPDPVVMHRCRGGFLIITAWGDEASDPLVVNEISN